MLMPFGLNGFALSGIFIALTCAVMAVIILLLARDRKSMIWGIFCITVFIWGLGAYRIGIATTPAQAEFWWRIAYIGVIMMPAFYTLFVFQFLEIKNTPFIRAVHLVTAVFLVLDATRLFIPDTHIMFGSLQYLSPSPIYNAFVAFFFISLGWCHVLLLLHFIKAEGKRKYQIGYFLGGSIISLAGGAFSYLPVYGIDIYPYPNVTVAFFPVIMGYGAMRHKLFDLRVVAAETLTMLMWMFAIVRIMLSWNQSDFYLDLAFLFITVILGVVLIKSVSREVNAREELAVSNTKLIELDKLKSQFLSFASHQLKSPLTSIKWQSQLITDGNLGTIPPDANKAAKEIGTAADHLLGLISEFLDLRRIEEGQMTYQFETAEIPLLVSKIVHQLSILAEHKGLTLTYQDKSISKTASVDIQKFSQVIQNLVDNAIKYTDRGSINVITENEDDSTITVSVTDTGHGLSPELTPRLFEQFMRAPNTAKQIEGTGLGLYIAKQIVNAHKGQIWASSPGPGKGSTFAVRIPTV